MLTVNAPDVRNNPPFCIGRIMKCNFFRIFILKDMKCVFIYSYVTS